jgi:hypothetical protein
MTHDKKPQDADDAPIDRSSDSHDDAVIAADDTGMLAGERLITEAELIEGESGRR